MTYALVARDPIAGEIGGAVQTHFFNAGAVVLWPEAGTGIVATMAMAETAYGRLGLRLLRGGPIGRPNARATARARLEVLAAASGDSRRAQCAGRAHGRELYRSCRPSV